jgi:hypothetical protein
MSLALRLMPWPQSHIPGNLLEAHLNACASYRVVSAVANTSL